jgi:hypothetical protein
MWRSLSLTMLQAEYRTERACDLPEYLGSTVRGTFGQELRARSCLESRPPCAACRQPDRCAAGALFGDPADGNGSAQPLGVTHPAASQSRGGSGGDQLRPYILVSPPWRSQAYQPGEVIRVGLTLVGRARVWLPQVRSALAGVGTRGLGVDRRPWALVRIAAVGPDMNPVEVDRANADARLAFPQLAGPELLAKAPPPAGQARLVFLTPADLKSHGQRVDRLDGASLFLRLIRRIGTLAEGFCSPPLDRPFDYHPLADLARQVVVADQQVSTVRWDRYSGRQGTKHPLSGLVGQALVTNIPDPLWPYLILGQWVHVGKAASFGHGRYAVIGSIPSARPTIAP